jgi:site-specific DNA-methyltransferase (adenine-specific)
MTDDLTEQLARVPRTFHTLGGYGRFTLGQDAFEYIRGMQAGSVHLCITDPPYESLEKHRAKGTTTRLKQSKASSNEWFDIFPNRRFEELFAALYRVMAQNTHTYVFTDLESLFVIKPAAERAGFKFWNAIVWDKVSIGMGYHYRKRYEFIAFFEKGKRRLNDLGIGDIITCARVRNGYPTEKPAAVVKVLITQSLPTLVLPPDRADQIIVLDPFMGSGVVGQVALERGFTFQGCDLSRKAGGKLLNEGTTEV